MGLFNRAPRCEANVCKDKATATQVVSGTGAPLVTAIGVCDTHDQQITSGQRVRTFVGDASYDVRRA